MFTQPIKSFTNTNFEQGDLSNRQKGRWVLMLPSTNFTAKWELVSVLT